MKLIAIYIFFALICIDQLICIREGVKYRFTKNACAQYNPKFILSFTCRLRFFNRTTPVTNAVAQFQPNLKLDKIRYEITTNRRFGTVYRPSLIIHHSEFICDALSNRGPISYLVNLLKSSYEKTSNILAPCPKTDKMYFNNTTVDTSKFPQFVPVGEYRVDNKIFTRMNGHEEFVFNFQSFIEVKPLGALEF